MSWKRILLGYGAIVTFLLSPSLADSDDDSVTALQTVLTSNDLPAVVLAADTLLSKRRKTIRMGGVPVDSHLAPYLRLASQKKVLTEYLVKFEDFGAKDLREAKDVSGNRSTYYDAVERFLLTPTGFSALEERIRLLLIAKTYDVALAEVERILRHPILTGARKVDYEIFKALLLKRLGLNGKEKLSETIYAKHREDLIKRTEPILFGDEPFNLLNLDKAMEDGNKGAGKIDAYVQWLSRLYMSGNPMDRLAVRKEYQRIKAIGEKFIAVLEPELSFLESGCGVDDDRFLTIKGGCLDLKSKTVWNVLPKGKVLWATAFEKCGQPVLGFPFHLASQQDLKIVDGDITLQIQLGLNKKTVWAYETYIQTVNSLPSTPRLERDEDGYYFEKEIKSYAFAFGNAERYESSPQVCKPNKDNRKSDCFLWKGKKNWDISDRELSQNLQKNVRIAERTFLTTEGESRYYHWALCVSGEI